MAKKRAPRAAGQVADKGARQVEQKSGDAGEQGAMGAAGKVGAIGSHSRTDGKASAEAAGEDES